MLPNLVLTWNLQYLFCYTDKINKCSRMCIEDQHHQAVAAAFCDRGALCGFLYRGVGFLSKRVERPIDDAVNLRQQVELSMYTIFSYFFTMQGNIPVQSFQNRVAYKVYPHFQERMMEIEDTNIMPHPVLKADHTLPACEKGTIVSGRF